MTHEELVTRVHEHLRTWFEFALGRMATIWDDQGLSLPQIRLLFVLAQSGPATITGLAERLHSSQPAASLLVDRLVQAHLAERTDDPTDRRRAIVRLTAKGEALMGRRLGGQQALLARLNELDDPHLLLLIDLFTSIANQAEGNGHAEGEAPGPDHSSS